jgi:hypothetical protein
MTGQHLLLPKPSLGRLKGNWGSRPEAWEKEQTNIHDSPFATSSVSTPVSLDEKVSFSIFSPYFLKSDCVCVFR